MLTNLQDWVELPQDGRIERREEVYRAVTLAGSIIDFKPKWNPTLADVHHRTDPIETVFFIHILPTSHPQEEDISINVKDPVVFQSNETQSITLPVGVCGIPSGETRRYYWQTDATVTVQNSVRDPSAQSFAPEGSGWSCSYADSLVTNITNVTFQESPHFSLSIGQRISLHHSPPSFTFDIHSNCSDTQYVSVVTSGYSVHLYGGGEANVVAVSKDKTLSGYAIAMSDRIDDDVMMVDQLDMMTVDVSSENFTSPSGQTIVIVRSHTITALNVIYPPTDCSLHQMNREGALVRLNGIHAITGPNLPLIVYFHRPSTVVWKILPTHGSDAPLYDESYLTNFILPPLSCVRYTSEDSSSTVRVDAILGDDDVFLPGGREGTDVRVCSLMKMMSAHIIIKNGTSRGAAPISRLEEGYVYTNRTLGYIRLKPYEAVQFSSSVSFDWLRFIGRELFVLPSSPVTIINNGTETERFFVYPPFEEPLVPFSYSQLQVYSGIFQVENEGVQVSMDSNDSTPLFIGGVMFFISCLLITL
ncbi:hypothetical protein PROFUN_13111 [Planoprotostelium fungivorum]|uniref:Uncharacterized protein n=1 Tax=Planoprotostelium fungivorum TaxID=1890364 RepID=A0A2P6N5D4_9EUKA|nr:hypothetical protein PROFUN_13111 [Planoprotostelium fungivorum]